MRRMPKEKTKEFLYEEYIVKNKSLKTIGDEIGVSAMTVYNWINRFNIETKKQNDFTLKKCDDLTGLFFGRLEVIDIHSISKSHKVRWTCKCHECNQIKAFLGSELKKRKNPTCGCILKGNRWTGYESIRGGYWKSIQGGAKARNLEFNIDIEYAWELFNKQNGVCALSGQKIHLSKSKKWDGEQTASLDRIDSSKGYILGNLQWIHKDINNMKMQFDQNYFIETCRKIAQHNDKLEK